MKNALIKTAVAAVASSAALSASAAILTHDFYTAAGDQQFHYVLTNGSLYEAAGGSNTSAVVENQALRIHYRSSSEGITNRNLSCSETNGDHTEGLQESWRADQINTYVSILGGQLPENAGLNADECDIDIGPQGEVLGGWNANEPTTLGGVTVSSFTVLTSPRRNVSYAGTCGDSAPGAGDGVDINTAFATNALYDEIIEANGEVQPGELDSHPNTPAKPAGCSTFGISRVSIGQCDPDEADTFACMSQLSKSVPVPAFAAAALALGLTGIIYLTGRDRKRK